MFEYLSLHDLQMRYSHAHHQSLVDIVNIFMDIVYSHLVKLVINVVAMIKPTIIYFDRE